MSAEAETYPEGELEIRYDTPPPTPLFASIPVALIRDGALSVEARIYAMELCISWQREEHIYKEPIAQRTGINVRKIPKLEEELIDRGWLRIEGRGSNRLYSLVTDAH